MTIPEIDDAQGLVNHSIWEDLDSFTHFVDEVAVGKIQASVVALVA